MEYRSAITLKPGDVLDIPGIGTRQIGAIDQMKHDRYLIRLDAKFKPSVVIRVNPMGEGRSPERHEGPWDQDSRGEGSRVSGAFVATPRIHSRDPQHLREDLAASLAAALGPDVSDADQAKAGCIVDSCITYGDAQSSLREVLGVFGPAVFGFVILFNSMAKTSLAGHGEGMTGRSSLAELGLTVRNLEWPAEELHVSYLDQAVEEPARDARLREAVNAWEAEHSATTEIVEGEAV